MIKTSIQNLLNQLDRIEQDRKELFEEVQLLPEELIRKKPSEEKWSILEIVEHLVLGEDYVLGASEKQLPRKRTPFHFFRYLFVMTILRSFVKVGVPSRKMRPESKSSLDELSERWENNHQKLRNYLENLDPDNLSDAIFFHPISGPLTVQQALNMMEVHLKRHRKQIEAIISLN